MDALVRQFSVFNIPRRILKHAISFPHIEQFFADGAGRDSTFVGEAMAYCLDQISGAGSDVLCEMVGAVICVAC
jgi:hypothetical protein